ncbi:unnamed protein product [Rotaria sordida]|uniref:Uncharacterized protein n=3 Tax=Rotaria sordida TaxID=392033 RepID=A0A815A8U4_9BILA|nr:unnamed protein product [Rotaria sordida]CAF3992191.1 unnamed protein product [Rotaria sordida]
MQFEKKFDIVDNSAYGDPIYFIAAVLDPSFKFLWIRDLKLPIPMENRLKQHIIELIINEMKKDLPASTIEPVKINFSSISSSIFSSSTTTTPQRKRRKLFNYDDNIINDSNASSTLDPAVELDAFSKWSSSFKFFELLVPFTTKNFEELNCTNFLSSSKFSSNRESVL